MSSTVEAHTSVQKSCGRQHQRLQQLLQCRLGRIAQAAVNRRCLDHCAARRDEPVETLGQRQQTNRPGLGTTSADEWDNRQMTCQLSYVNSWRDRREPGSIERDPRAKK